eukprot:TRINITY_DN2829_c0_g1_i2.p1 TRINITY_DN2829_c0_g1~~TRINITY_DN2829_c0_g1_i2.p1  ORF type:complete len:325 (+),score=75.63 TRINITY_DN2829_c0_g1_i2:790-1764(+)
MNISEENCQNIEALPDFGGGHPDPNLVYAASLVKRMYSEDFAFGCAFDGDGDRNMILGNKFFVTPSDSVAIIAANSGSIPYFRNKLSVLARSMPTSGAIDRVAEKMKAEFFEVPTGWKFFGNIMDHYENEKGGFGHVICGEESFGTGSDHVREKDGIWAALCWLSILADKKVSVEEVVRDHWKEFGRNYYSRYDYENCEAAGARSMMEHLVELTQNTESGTCLHDFPVPLKFADEFSYADKFDGSVSEHQGIRFVFEDGSRIIFRLSGTGSVGATIRLYLEQYEANVENHDMETQDALKALVQLALTISKIEEFTGRTEPTVIT